MVNRVTKRGLALLLAFSIVFPIFGNLVQVQAASGTSENPYSVSEAIVKQDGAMAFVEGYVVGHYNTSNKKVFGSTHPTQLNLLLADSADSTEVLAVQVAKAARGEYTADLINTKVKLKGTLADYFGQEGLKNVSAIERVAESSPVETSAEVVETTAEMVETFEEVLETSVETPVAKTYTISFGENLGKAKKFGGNIQVPENIVSEENTVVKLPEAVENEVSIDWTSPFKFMGWKLDGQGELLAPGTEVTVTADQNYVAIYERVTGLFTFRFSFYKEDGCQLSNPKNCELTDENGNLLRDSIRKNANAKEDYTLTSGDLVYYHNPIFTRKDAISFDQVKPDITYKVKLTLPEGVKIDAERTGQQQYLSNFTDDGFDMAVQKKSSSWNNKTIYLIREEVQEETPVVEITSEVLRQGDRKVSFNISSMMAGDVIKILVDGKVAVETPAIDELFSQVTTATFDVQRELIAGEKVEVVLERAGQELARSAEKIVEGPLVTEYTVSFGENLGKPKNFGGDIKVPENIVAEENSVIKLPEAVEEKVEVDWTSPHKFMGWKLDGQGELLAPGTEVTVTADQKYIAIYERVTGLFTFRFSFYKEEGCQLSNPKTCELTDENGNLLRDSIRKNANDKEDYTLTSGDLVFYHNPINTSKDSINFDEVKPDLTYTVKLNLPEGVKIDAERMAAQRDLSNFTDNTFDILVRPKSSTHNNKVIYLLKEEKVETKVIFNLVDENGNKIEGLDPVEKKAPVTLKEGQTSTLRLRSKDLPEGYGFVSGTSFPAEVLYGETKEVNVPVKAKKTQVTVSFSYKDKNGTSQTMPELTFTEIYEEGNTNFVDNGDGTLTYTLPADKIPAGYEKAMESDGIAKVDKYGKGYLLVELKHTPAEIEIASPVLVEGDTGVKVKTGNLEKDDVIKILVDGEEVGEFKMPFVGSTNRTITVEPELVEGQNVEATVERNGVEVGRSESKPVESKIDIEITSPVLVDGDKGVKVKAGNLEKDDVIEIRVDGKKIGEYKMPFAGAPSRTIDVDSALVAGQKVEAIIRRSGTEMGRSAEKIVEEKKEIEITSTPLKAGDNNVSVSTGDLVKGDVIEIRVDGKKITDYILPFDGVTVKRTIDLGIDLEEGQVVEAVVRRSGVEMARSEEVVVEAIETTEEETTAEETTAEETTVEETTVEETSVEETTLEETTVEETTLEETSVEEITEEETTSETTEEETTVEETTLEETTAEETTVETTEETTVETTEETSVETTQEETTEETSVETTQEETTEETTAETVEESDKKEIAFLTFKFEGVLDGMTEAFQIEAKVGDTIIIPDAPVREGFVFDYWKGSVYHPGDKYLVEDDHVFTAMWKNEETTEEPVSQEPQETTGELIEKDPTDKTEEPKQDTSSDKSEKSNEDNVAGGKVQSETKGTGTKTEGKNLSLNPQTSDEGILVYGVVLVLALAADFIIRKKMREEITK